MLADEPVTRAMFGGQLHPISQPHRLSQVPQWVWSDEAWERFTHGLRARDMDERWHVITEGNVVYAHRSWTGFGIFAAAFEPVPGGHRIIRVDVERDIERYRTRGDADDCLTLEFVLSTVLLGETSADLRGRILSRRGSRPDPDA